MALNPLTFSTLMTASYEKVINFGVAWEQGGDPVPFDLNYHEYFAFNYDYHAREGEVKGGIIKEANFNNQGGDWPALALWMKTLTSMNNVPAFAFQLATYWSTVALVPGPPMHGGVSVVSIVNDALDQVPAFEAAITAAMGALPLTPWFAKLPESIQTIALPQVTWTVTELIPSGSGVSPVPFPEKIV